MTAKETLREAVEKMTEEQAEQLLAQVEEELSGATHPRAEAKSERRYHPTWEAIRELMKDVPEEELANLPPARDVDKVLYGIDRDTATNR